MAIVALIVSQMKHCVCAVC